MITCSFPFFVSFVLINEHATQRMENTPNVTATTQCTDTTETDTNSLQQDIQTHYNGNYRLVLLHHRAAEAAALHPQLDTNWQFPMNPNYCISRSTSTPILLDRQCQILLLSPFLSPVITPEQANPCWCLYLKRMFREQSSTLWGLHHHSLIAPTPFCPSQRVEGFPGYLLAYTIQYFCHDLF